MIVQVTDTRFIKIHELDYDKESACLYLEASKEEIIIQLLDEEKYRLLSIERFRESLARAISDKIKYYIQHNHPIIIEELKTLANSITR